MVQGREFNYSLTLSVIVGLLVAFATVITATATSGIPAEQCLRRSRAVWRSWV